APPAVAESAVRGRDVGVGLIEASPLDVVGVAVRVVNEASSLDHQDLEVSVGRAGVFLVAALDEAAGSSHLDAHDLAGLPGDRGWIQQVDGGAVRPVVNEVPRRP